MNEDLNEQSINIKHGTDDKLLLPMIDEIDSEMLSDKQLFGSTNESLQCLPGGQQKSPAPRDHSSYLKHDRKLKQPFWYSRDLYKQFLDRETFFENIEESEEMPSEDIYGESSLEQFNFFDASRLDDSSGLSSQFLDDKEFDTLRENPTSKANLIELTQIDTSWKKPTKKQAKTLFTVPEDHKSQYEFSQADSIQAQQNSSIVTLEIVNNKQINENYTSKLKPKQCLHGIFLRHFLTRYIPLGFYLYFMICLDILIAGIITRNLYQVFEAPPPGQSMAFLISKDLLYIVLNLLTISFSILLIRQYKLLVAKILYGIKLAMTLAFVIFEVTKRIEVELDPSISEFSFGSHKSKWILDFTEDICILIYQVLTCWVMLSVIFWIRRGSFHVIKGIKKIKKQPEKVQVEVLPSPFLKRKDYILEFKLQIDDSNQEVPREILTEGSKNNADKVNLQLLNSYSMYKQKTKKHNFRRNNTQTFI